MRLYDVLADIFVGESPFAYFTAFILIMATAFSSFMTFSRSDEYIKSPDADGFKSAKKAANFLNGISFFMYLWCIFAVVYLLAKRYSGGVGALYILITVFAAGAVIFSVISRSKFSKAKNIYNSLYLKANKGNLTALMGNPLGLEGREQDALNSILNGGEKYAGGVKSDPLNDILSGAVQIKKTAPAEAAKDNLSEAQESEFRECPFCKKQVEKKFPICIYCGMLIPDKNYRQDNKADNGWESVNKM